jgi:hypothetical protein
LRYPFWFGRYYSLYYADKIIIIISPKIITFFLIGIGYNKIHSIRRYAILYIMIVCVL